jgi:hypothetical protein
MSNHQNNPDPEQVNDLHDRSKVLNERECFHISTQGALHGSAYMADMLTCPNV